MNDDLINKLKYISNNPLINGEYDEENYLFDDEAKLLLDYITNLQEETERQSKAQVILDNQIAEMLKYKERNEKAIEYIKQSIDNPQPFYEYLFGDENGKVENLDKLLNILQGDNTLQENLYKYTPEKGFRLVGDEDVKD